MCISFKCPQKRDKNFCLKTVDGLALFNNQLYFQRFCSSEDEAVISEEEILRFKENETKLMRKRQELRETLRQRFDNMQHKHRSPSDPKWIAHSKRLIDAAYNGLWYLSVMFQWLYYALSQICNYSVREKGGLEALHMLMSLYFVKSNGKLKVW